MARRDNFSASTKELLARRVGYRCSHPECPLSTIGPALGDTRAVNIGQAAHITAAASGGPRYDASLSEDERRSFENGIWMCANHAKQVDSDEEHFSVGLLREWKANAEKEAFDALTSGNGSPAASTLDIDEELLELLERLGLSKDEDIQALTERARKAAISDLDAFKAREGWPRHAVKLNLRSRGSNAPAFDVDGCAAGLSVTGELSLVAPPGTGKSTTLVQLTEKILAVDSKVAIFVLLNEWSCHGGRVLDSLTHRAAFRGISEQDFMLLAIQGRLALMLDGWNELDAASRRRAIAEVQQLRREFPLLEMAISTRRQMQNVPISGPTVEIEPLSENQQLEIAWAMCGNRGEALLDRAWRIPGLRALVSIPLYLRVLLKHSPDGEIPTTKEELIRLFVTEHERLPENTEVLRTELDDVHAPLLTALAVEATTSTNTAITQTRSRSVVSETAQELRLDGQISGELAPAKVLDLLVAHHTLVRLEGTGGDISFQHQQIQEWYASLEVEKLISSAANGRADDATQLRVRVLNMPPWEEAILFACERLSRRDQTGVASVAFAIQEALAVDPMLAAEMIYRSAPPVWGKIKDTVIRYVDQWHTKGKVDRAVRFMIATGKEDFASLLWPLITNPDQQVYLAAFRIAQPFRPTVLGHDVLRKLSELPAEIREHVVSQIAWESGIDGMELATRVAKTDPVPDSKLAVIEALIFRRCDRLVRDVLDTAPQAVWTLLAQKGYARQIRDQEAAARLSEEERAIVEKEPNVLQRLEFLSRSKGEVKSEIHVLISSPDFPVREQNARWVLSEISKRHLAAVVSGLVRRLANGLAMPFGSEELLASAPIVDEGPIATMLRVPKLRATSRTPP
jgi:hypothetical protein